MTTLPQVERMLPFSVPEQYKLGIDGWSFPLEKLMETLADGTRKLLTLDVSISPDAFVQAVNQGGAEGLAQRVNDLYSMICSNNCPGCFEKGYVENPLLSFEELKQYVIEPAIELGLESVKFLGPGELLTNPDLFKILDYLQEKDIKIGIFTKGDILGDDGLAQHYQGMSSEELVKKVCSYDITRVLIDCRTFDEEKANRGTHSVLGTGYMAARNRAIELLVQNGMNSELYNQRMSLQLNPLTPDTIDEVLEIFMWAAERNIPAIVTPTMVSGKGWGLVERSRQPDFQEKLIQLYTDIYTYLIERGIMTTEQLHEEGVSSYAGTAPCNQLSCGLYVRKDGVVQACPGNDSEQFRIAQDVRTTPLRDIWMNSRNYALGAVYNNHCVKDDVSLPSRLYEEVLRRVEAHYA